MPDEKRDVQVKAFEAFEIKDESTGEVEAIIATLNVVDKDFEVITKDAIKSGSKVSMSSYGHDGVGFTQPGLMPVGRGKVFIEDDKAVFRGNMFMSTVRGRETLSVLKEMGSDQQWSFGFRVMGSEVPDEEWTKAGAKRMLTKLDVFEVSPVIIGAGVGTQTLAAKEADGEPSIVIEGNTITNNTFVTNQGDGATKTDEEVAAETARVAAEQKTAEEAETRRLADEADIQRLADEAAAVETKRLDDEAARKARAKVDREEYERVRRSLRKMGVLTQ